MVKNKCEVCESTTHVSCNHFGAKSCKACAAFFRRTISMKLSYQCIENVDFCRVHCDSRLICRFCRLVKCKEVGMKARLVKSKNERKNYIRMSKGLLPKEDEQDEELPSTSSEISETLEKFEKLENFMCDRRRLLYADTPIRILLEGERDWPYSTSCLKIFDYKISQGMSKHDFVMIMDYAREMPGFSELNYADSVFVYRLVCAVDFVINSAYYTYKHGIDRNQLIMHDGTYIPMIPTPLSGYEENANLLFENQDDLCKFRALMPLLLKQWQTAIPFAELRPTYSEFCLLKAICVWTVSWYRLSEEGRRVATEQRDRLIRALNYTCEQHTSDNSGARFGNVMLALNYIVEQIRNLNCSFVMISFFGIINVDSLMIDVTSFW